MKKSKIASLALAGALTATVLLAGTYAWQSISQEALNEVNDVLNPGGRLHDDFSGLDTGEIVAANSVEKVKNVYVENFTSKTNGATIYARIRLDEYLETGLGAGTTDADKEAEPIVPGVPLEQKDKWTTYLWDETSIFRSYIQLETGGSTVYMPTYNMNKDSLEADINGTLGGEDGNILSTEDAYKDYEPYAEGDTEQGVEIHDADADTADELGTAQISTEQIIAAVIDQNGTLLVEDTDTEITVKIPTLDENGTPVKDENGQLVYTEKPFPILETETITGNDGTTTTLSALYIDLDPDATPNDGADIKIVIVDEEHVAKETATADLLSMEEWINDYNAVPGPYWVYDTDGWVYWAFPIKPGETTGCLLNGIKLNPGADISDEYYYGVNVVAQFATKGHWGEGSFKEDGTAAENGTGFYAHEFTENGLYLLEKVSEAEKTVTITATTTIPEEGLKGADDVTTADITENSATFKAEVKQGAVTLKDETVTWSVERNTSTATTINSSTGVLTIGADEEATSVVVVAKSGNEPITLAKYIVPIDDWYTVEVTQVDGNSAYAAWGSVITYEAEVKERGATDARVGVTWKVVNSDGTELDPQYGTTITSEGVLKIGENETATSLKVIATCNNDTTVVGEIAVPEVITTYEYIRDHMEMGTTEKIQIDGIEWYALYRKDVDDDLEEEVLLWASDNITLNKEVIQMRFDDNDNVWQESDMQTYLHNTVLPELTELKDRAQAVTLTTRSEWNAEDTDFKLSEEQSIFLLSEADLTGKVNYELTGKEIDAVATDYTVTDAKGNGVQLITDANSTLKNASAGWYWLRSPRGDNYNVAVANGVVFNSGCGVASGRVRPALWINLPAETENTQ